MAYFSAALTPEHDNVWYADRNDRNIFAKSNNMLKASTVSAGLRFKSATRSRPKEKGTLSPRKKRLSLNLARPWPIALKEK